MSAEIIDVIRITNPFNPSEFVREQLTWGAAKSLSDYFPLGTTAEQVISINGKIIPSEDFAVTHLDIGDNIVVCPIPTGGGGSKQILGLVAMIALSIVAPYAAVALNGTMGLGLAAGSLGMSMLTAGVMMAGSLLVSTIFAPSKPSNTNGANSSTYGIDGAKNTAVEGIPVPINYGKFRTGGNIISLHVENETDDHQNLFVLINAGEGPIAGITDILVNDNPVESYRYTLDANPNTNLVDTIEVQMRLGTPDQPVIPWFAENIAPHSLGTKLTTSWTHYATVASIDKVRLDFVAPQGLFKIDTGSGATTEVKVDLEIQYRRAGTTAWSPMPLEAHTNGSVTFQAQVDMTNAYMDGDGNYWRLVVGGTQVEGAPNYEQFTPTFQWVYASSGLPITDVNELAYISQNYELKNGVTGTLPVYSTDASMTSSQRSAFRMSFFSPALTPGMWEFQMRRTVAKSTDATVSDEVYISDVNEIQLDAISYANTALLALKIRIGDQISGMPNITFMNGGKVIQVYGKPFAQANVESWYSLASTNPAWIVWDMLTNQRYGGAMPTTRLDFRAFKRWADYCDAEGLTWNGPIDTEMNVWDASQYVLRCGHAQLVNVGTRWTVVVEQAADPVMMFSVANMVENTYTETWLPQADRANEVDVTFFDKEDLYKQRTIKIYDPAALTAGAKQRSSAVTLYGVVDADRAYEEGMFMMNLNRYILKTIKFQAPMEAVACTAGDLILVQHDMPNWAQAGRFEAGSSVSAVNLDRPVTMVAGKSYKLLALHDSLMRVSGTITNIVGDIIFLSNMPGSATVKRLQAGGKDVSITEVYPSSLAVSDPTGLAIGQTYQLFDTDVIEEILVVNQPGDTTALTLQSPLSAIPAQFGQWMFGETTKVKAPFRIKSISSVGDYNREILALQYDDRVYDNTRFASQHVPVANPKDAVISQVRSLAMYEESYVAGSNIVTSAVGTWQSPITGNYAGADVYVRIGTDTSVEFTLFGDAKHRNDIEVASQRGQTVTLKVVAYDFFGKRAPFTGAPELTLKLVGEVSQILVGSVTGADVLWNGRDCRLTWRYNSTTHSYEFGSEPVGASAGALDPQFQDYEISVWHASDATTVPPRRVEHVTDNSYSYTYEKNFTDGLERNLRFTIRMRDKFNNLGTPTTLTAYNPPPTISGFSVDASFESANLTYTHSDDPDYAGVQVWLSRTRADVDGDITRAGFDASLVYTGPDTSCLLTSLMFSADYFVRIAGFDVFGKTELIPSSVLTFRTTNLDVNAIAAGSLSDSLLIPALQARINLVDGPATLSNSVAALLATEAAARATSITNEQTLRTAGDTNLAQTITTLSARVDTSNAAIATEQSARATQDTALATSITALQATVSDNTAAIQSEQTTRANADSANATAISTVSTTVGQNTTSIQTQATSINGLSGQYTVKIDSNGYVSGFGFASSSPVNGTPTSEFIIRADKFSMVMPGYPSVYPFTIAAVNGVPRVIISSALIGDATITSAKIGNLEVNTSNIASGAVSAAVAATGPTGCSVTITVPANAAAVVIMANAGTSTNGGGGETGSGGSMQDYGNLTVSGYGAIAVGTGVLMRTFTNPTAGTYTFSIDRYQYGSTSVVDTQISVQVLKR